MARRENDAYYTPDHVAEKCVRVLDVEPMVVWEPHVGGGAFARACRKRWPEADIHGTDIDNGAPGRSECNIFCHGDLIKLHEPVYGLRPDLVVGNPPFKRAEEHLRHIFKLVDDKCVVAMLLRLGFLASKKRHEFWEDYPVDELWVLQRRPSFTGNKRTDSQEYAFFVWKDRHRPAFATQQIGWI